LANGLRNITQLELYPGARCDVLVSCDGSAEHVSLVGSPQHRNAVELEEFSGAVLTMHVTGSDRSVFKFPEFEVIEARFKK
jgi:hypothetical protein